MDWSAPIVWFNEHGALTRDRSVAVPCLKVGIGRRSEGSFDINGGIHLWGMVDTGTDYCHVPMEYLRKIGARPGPKRITVHGHMGNFDSPLYEIDAIFEGIGLKIELEAVEMKFPHVGRPFQLILGKSVFQYSQLTLGQPDRTSEFRWVGDYRR